MVENMFSTKIKAPQNDEGEVFVNNQIFKFVYLLSYFS